MDTFEKVRGIIVDSLGVEADAVTETANIKEDFGADSLAVVELVMALEDAFGISIPEEKLKEIATVADIIALVGEQ
ncbi:MAG: acyl carrier protein [Oscillospiraceae bacterium]|jgi:acyl carrier protein|nr:acyl carrier protein [Oscillospiraceae bacterium]